MPDRELIDHYKMIEKRMMDIDHSREQLMEKEREIYGKQYPYTYYNRLGHLHIGDNLYELKKEKNLILDEMKNRGISPP